MASSSSSSQSLKYDVFLSFRGTDTRCSFVDHFYSALDQQGIYTYKDDQTLTRGQTIAPSLFKAIEESRIAVIVFSENYAGSSWCLQELEHIMKCKDERGLIVMPIFYHVDPSDLRNQKRKYGEAFAKHESENENFESWRKALVDAGNLAGDEIKGPETKFIKKIVDTISNRLCLSISRDNEHLIGIEGRVQDLKSKMKKESDGVVMVGIWGLGGGGKTTLASALYHEISSRFDGSCFLKDVREESSKHGLSKLQKEILSRVLKQKKGELVGDVGSLIKSRFVHKKVLLVLDDVDHLDQLKELAGSDAWFGKGSRIIITTRDENLLNAHKVNVIHNICLLKDDEAIQLFFKHAVGHVSPIEDQKMLSEAVVAYACGLPLALKVLGSFLCDKNKREWTSALARLKDIPDISIMEKLKISYDGLDNKQKELFLDIACLFRGKEKDKTMEILDACGFHPIIGVKVLIQKTLITVSEEGTFEMHDLIQEMGHYIVRGENPKNPEKRSRIWLGDQDTRNIFAMDSMMENFEIEALYFPWGGIPLDNLPKVLANMKKLRLIALYRYSATSLPRAFQPMNLCYLRLGGSSIEQLWEGYKYLPNLKVLDLFHSEKLVRTPDFDGLPYLERIILRWCKNLKEISSSIGNLERLIYLDITYCKSLEVFPPITRMKKLETFLLCGCSQLRKFPDIETNMDNLVELDLEDTGIEVVPSLIGRYCTNLVTLRLSGCKCLQSIEGNFCHLQHLEKIYLGGCDQLKIPSEGLFDVKCCLQVLSLSDTSLKKFCQGMVSMKLLGFSTCLRWLNLSWCNLEDGDISSVFFQELSNLEALDLSHNKFSRLHSSLLQFPHLKFLNLSHCSNLVELPDLPSSIAILRANYCESLGNVGDFPTNHLKWLWKVSLVSVTNSRRVDGKRVVESMLQGSAVEDYFLSLLLDKFNISARDFGRKTCMLELPSNWCNEFSGFLIYATLYATLYGDDIYAIIIEVSDDENEDNVLEVSDDETTDEAEESKDETTDEAEESNNETTDEDEGGDTVDGMCYISFGSLMHTTWLNSPHTKISFSIEHADLKVELVPRRSKGGSIERLQDATNSSGFWDEEVKQIKAFEIIHDSKSSIRIQWYHELQSDIFRNI